MLLATACARDRTSANRWTATDSAGIAIVTNRAPVWTGAPVWKISATPALDMGGAGSDSAHTFFRIRDTRLLPDGRIAVVNSSSNEIRFFDRDGRHLGNIGRRGEGPGEFVSLWDVVQLEGDTLLAYDARMDRFTWFNAGGAPVRTAVRNEAGGHGDRAMSLLPDASLFVVSGPAYEINSPSGFFRPDFAAFRFPADGSPPDSIGAWPGSETWVRVVDRSVSVHVPLFPRATFFAPTTTAIWLGSNDRYQIEKVGFDGRARMIVRVDSRPVPVTDAMVRDQRDRRLEGIEDADFRRRMRTYFDEMPVPETLPAFDGLMVDDLGYPWVRHYSNAEAGGAADPVADGGGEGPRSYDVFRPDGRWLGTLPVPAGFQPLQIGRDYLLGVYRDELGVEHVQRWRLENRNVGVDS